MEINTKKEIITALDDRVHLFCDYIRQLDKNEFEATPNNKWSAGQNLDHLIRSMQPLLLAYSLPGFILEVLFGKANRPSKTFEQLVAKYRYKLAEGGRASGRFVPKPVGYAGKDLLLQRYIRMEKRLSKKIAGIKEEKLDRFILPHPLLGKLTLREMLFFTIHHNEHHLETLKNREGSIS
jgi:hypothetical protein